MLQCTYFPSPPLAPSFCLVPSHISIAIPSACTDQTSPPFREELREQHELTQEIGNAITSMPITEPIDEEDLETELEALEQENLDKELLKTGTVPVNDRVNALPQAANGPSESCLPYPSFPFPIRR